jgi:hypothetical protein
MFLPLPYPTKKISRRGRIIDRHKGPGGHHEVAMEPETRNVAKIKEEASGELIGQ